MLFIVHEYWKSFAPIFTSPVPSFATPNINRWTRAVSPHSNPFPLVRLAEWKWAHVSRNTWSCCMEPLFFSNSVQIHVSCIKDCEFVLCREALGGGDISLVSRCFAAPLPLTDCVLLPCGAVIHLVIRIVLHNKCEGIFIIIILWWRSAAHGPPQYLGRDWRSGPVGHFKPPSFCSSVFNRLWPITVKKYYIKTEPIDVHWGTKVKVTNGLWRKNKKAGKPWPLVNYQVKNKYLIQIFK